jgi:hypothetical protein
MQNYISRKLFGDYGATDPSENIPVEEQVLQQAQSISEFDLFAAVDLQSADEQGDVFRTTLNLKIEISKRREEYPTSLAPILQEKRGAIENILEPGSPGLEPGA